VEIAVRPPTGLLPGRGPSPFLSPQVRGRRADARSRAPIPATEMTHRATPRSEESARKPTRGGKPRNPTRPNQLTTVTPSPVRTPGMLPAAANVRGKSVDTPNPITPKPTTAATGCAPSRAMAFPPAAKAPPARPTVAGPTRSGP